ncbi:xanthine dehydrogenase family protein subunit M [Streptomyces sp. WAC06614]|uniref:FAD binding domain-containing protein n=1 Tax=Streptomyces sp. WAC06614 TaxID=2487416 RepID=UPI000F7A09A9|nr:FAD binding domain-containing protein [Streptomyces sp. WAC06614]RSS78555.1 xanthine dehydrogenase family protein subunit M [Streptomyces sp. WAC06614]
MKPAPFSYVRPATAEEAVGHLAAAARAGREARVLAGGQSLLPLLNQRLVRPDLLVDLGRVPGLAGVRADGSGVWIGALTPHAAVERSTDRALHRDLPVLPEAAALIGRLPVRIRGTVGGSLAHADPCAEWCLLAVLLDAELTLLGPDGTRVVGAAAFLRGRHLTALRPGEILTGLRFPAAEPAAALVEYGVQPGRLPEAAAAAALTLCADGRIAAARIAVAGPAEVPFRAPHAEAMLLGARPGAEAFTAAAARAVGAGRGELSALAGALLRRALAESADRARVLAPVRRPAPVPAAAGAAPQAEAVAA